MKIIALSIQNFKGISGRQVIQFDPDKSVIFLHGPNGFGKTTIFDALELCLTGVIYRIGEKSGTTSANEKHEKAFYQNKINEPVELRLLIENNDGQRRVIIRYLDPIAGARNGVADWHLIKAAMLYDPAMLEGELNVAHLQSGEAVQPELNAWLLGDDARYGLRDVYDLFAYQQQEENISYLEQTQRERKDTLALLTSTTEETERLEHLKEYEKQLNKLKAVLLEEKTNIEKSLITQRIEEVPYTKLLNKVTRPFDTEDPYGALKSEALDEVHRQNLQEVGNFETFLQTFSPSEYSKSVKQKAIRALAADDSAVEWLCFRNLLEPDTYHKLSFVNRLGEGANNDTFCKSYLLQNYLRDEDRAPYKKAYADWKLYTSFLKNDDGTERSLEDKLKFLIKDTLRQTTWAYKASDWNEQLEAVVKGLTLSSKTADELISTRDMLVRQFDSYSQHPHAGENLAACPLCGHDWKRVDKLIHSIDTKTAIFKTLTKNQLSNIENLRSQIKKEFLDTIDNRARIIIADNEKASKFYELIMLVMQQLGDLDYRSDYQALSKTIPEAQTMIMQWITTPDGLDNLATDLRNKIAGRLQAFDTVMFKRLRTYEQYEQPVGLDILSKEQQETLQKLALTRLGTQNDFIKARDTLRAAILESAATLDVDEKKLGGDKAFYYKEYFGEDQGHFQTAKDGISQKRQYLIFIYNKKRSRLFTIIDRRYAKVSRLLASVSLACKTYKEALDKYKKSIVESVKIPFFIYSAKLLQNYQQGLGVYLDNSKSSIKFMAGKDTDHDVIHQLSSGQLAVVSMAFCLAINKVYAKPRFKFLAIDDPVKDLDALNVHSLIELMRREFLDDYQLIIAAHDEMMVSYMDYRFTKILGVNKTSFVNVQQTFFSTNEPV